MAKNLTVVPDQWMPRGEVAVTANRRVPLVVFGGIVGEAAEVKVVYKGQNQHQALFVETDTPSPHRMQVPCERYEPCGGCPLMHVSPEGQEDVRTAHVRRALDEEGLSDVEVEGWHPSPDGYFGFRHVVKLGVGWSNDGKRIKVGAFGRRSRSIVPIPKCDVAAPVLRQAMAAIAHHILELGLEPYDPETDRGVLRAVVLRASRTSNEVMVTLVAGRRPRKLDELAEAVAGQVGEITGIWVHLNSEPGNTLFKREEDGSIGLTALIGKDWIEEDLDGIGIRVGPGDFYQTNPSMALPLYKRTLERLEPQEGEAFVDLYCGVGGLTLLASRVCGFALGVEGVAGAVRRARESARRARITAEFVTGQVEEELPKLRERLKHPLVAVDPARRGLEPAVLDALIDMKPRKIAYISCNPRTLARDLAAFKAAGAEIGPVELFDMFPHTAHVECLTIVSFPVQAGRAPRRRRVTTKA
ncbi:MAG: 23S rRNA (uracil(1939)-C(5))-methyltransferase RlmD [Myxococcota bacterium]